MNLKSISCIALFLALLLTTPSNFLAQGKQEIPSLGGTVLNAIDGKPFKDVRIWVLDEYSESQFVIHTDKTGHYAVELPEGYYFVLIGTGGYIPACKSIWVLPRQTVNYSVRLSPDHENMIY